MAENRDKMRRPAILTDLLNSIFSGSPLERRLKEGRIWQVWDSAVGKQISERARPVSFRDGTLIVAVNSSPWMQQLTFLKKGIMDKLNGLLGEDIVRDIYLKAGRPERLASATTPAKPLKRPLSAAERQKISHCTVSVNDPELRASIKGLLVKHLEIG